ncbi:MAG: hypothetical protein JRH14_20050 [Deltaproteobacteria bacterium]|nr:hypothetical protein [Deltaproteobacteria bacterium]
MDPRRKANLVRRQQRKGSQAGRVSAHDEIELWQANALGVVTCEPHPDGGTVLCWLAFARPAGAIKWLAGKKIFEVALGGGIKALERKFPYR